MQPSKHCLKNRLTNFRSHFSKWKVEGFIIEDPVDLFYFTGIKLSRGRLLIGKGSAHFFVDGRYQEVAKGHSPYPVNQLNGEAIRKSLIEGTQALRYGCDTCMTVKALRELRPLFKGRTLKGIDAPTAPVRAIKGAEEIRAIRKSGALLWEGLNHVLKGLKRGTTERELSQRFEFYVKSHGAERLSFDPIVAFGPHSALPHHHPSDRELKVGDPVLIDIGVVVDGYASDLTRTVFFGTPSERLHKIYRLVLCAHQSALAACLPGVKVSKLDALARDAMGKEEKHFIHALGHGIGLEVHEYPRIGREGGNLTLEKGMVITIEPGIYIPKVGGVRHEDMVIITDKGFENLFRMGIEPIRKTK